jgi:hypothetical protein
LRQGTTIDTAGSGLLALSSNIEPVTEVLIASAV